MAPGKGRRSAQCAPLALTPTLDSMATLVLTILGNDKPGLVDAVAEPVNRHGGNWDESHMAHLAGKFAGIALVTVPDRNAQALIADLESLEEEGVLNITVEQAVANPESATDINTMTVAIVGQDRPGIVHDISRALAAESVSITELRTAITPAPMAGGSLFTAHVELHVPAGLSTDELLENLQDLADRLMVDVELHPPIDT